MKKIGVVLSGSGVNDGTEIHEATLTLLFLDKAGVEIVCMAPDIEQYDLIDHLSGQEIKNQKRNVLKESARIARGELKDMAQVKSSDIDGIIFPGGYGAAKNLCNFAVKGIDCKVNQEVERIIRKMHQESKPMGFICIAPVLAAKVLGEFHPQLTIGNDPDTAENIKKMGGKHIICEVKGVTVDRKNKIVSTPAYMLGPTISKIAEGIEKLVNKVLELA
ncbi:MAG: isoprenoid biosynthesis glyoxalase ElbB [Candidatus Bathyarchaeota archaeon]|nr:isoprenoid biosynthesis glyoxalase ElbB [Candidatus Bathyarchaeota archaeon]